MICITNTGIVLPEQEIKNSSVSFDSGVITQIFNEELKAEKVIDGKNGKLLYGFTDIHNHGAFGIDVNEADADSLLKVSKHLATNGVTAWLPTLVPDADSRYESVIKAIDEVMGAQNELPIAQILGVHYEGVFANESMCGALRPKYFKSFKSGNEISKLPRLKRGIHFTTLAPEIENGIDLIKELVKQGWIVSIGHTKAEANILNDAVENGAKHFTHFFNAMTGLHHRDLGVAGWGLTNKDTTLDIIADAIHVHPKMLKLAVEAKGIDKVSLISDSIAPTGLGDGKFEIWNEEIKVMNRKTQNEKGSIAGSVITMLDAFRQMMSIGFTLSEVSKMASLNPAKLLGINKIVGSIEIGKQADLVLLNKDGEIEKVFIKGLEVPV